MVRADVFVADDLLVDGVEAEFVEVLGDPSSPITRRLLERVVF